MARSQFVIPFTASFEETNQKIESILKENGFFLKDYQFSRLWTSPDIYTDMLRKFRFVCTPDFSMFTDFPLALQINSLFLKDYHGETVWKKGTGAMTAMQYIKLEYGQGSVTLYGWVQAGLGDVGGKEMDLKGFFGAMPKQSLLKVIKKIQAAVS